MEIMPYGSAGTAFRSHIVPQLAATIMELVYQIVRQPYLVWPLDLFKEPHPHSILKRPYNAYYNHLVRRLHLEMQILLVWQPRVMTHAPSAR